ncbi:MAG: hypothetical protein DWQ36_12645 [Acidobacteria bacterium]|nr:MAG: hypothetical protein DWQ30_13055 [Acidobacteriota bacterium]REK07387.1 MAG: hypothetical protein DWQ36_12645 [Acidobacteriota bacterium]
MSWRGNAKPPPGSVPSREPSAAPPLDTTLDPTLERILSSSTLEASTIALVRSALPADLDLDSAATRIEELIDHFETGRERGVDEAELRRRFRPGREVRTPSAMPSSNVPPHAATAARKAAPIPLEELSGAVRTLARNPTFLLGNAATLAIGLAAAIALFALFDAIFVRPLPFDEPAELFELRERTADGREVFPSYPNFADVREEVASFDAAISTTWGGPVTVLGLGKATQLTAIGISTGFFEALGVRPTQGRLFLPEEQQPGGPGAALVSEEMWTSLLGGNPDLDQHRLTLGGESVPVVGVIPRGFRLLQEADLYLSHERYPGTVRGAHAYQVVVRLADGHTQREAEVELQRFYDLLSEQHAGEMDSSSARLTPLQERVVGSFADVLAALFAASLLVVLIASGNVGASLAARTRRRRGEIAVRRALGATSGRIVVRQVAEAAALTTLALAGGWLLARAALGWVRAAASDQIPRLHEVSFDGGVYAFAAIVATVALALSVIQPLRTALEASPAATLRGGTRGGRRSRWGRSLLVALQIGVAFVLAVGAALLMRSFETLYDEELGFESEGVVAAHVQLPSSRYSDPEAARAFERQLTDQTRAIPGVRAVAVANYLPYDWGNWAAPVVTPEAPEDWVAIAGWRLVSPNYFEVMQIPLVAGEMLPDDGRHEGSTAALVNRSLAQKLSPGGSIASVVGRRVKGTMDSRSEWLVVVGVVEEARHWRAEAGAQPELFVHHAQRTEEMYTRVFLLDIGSAGAGALRAFEDRLRRLDADVPARLVALDERFAQTLERERLAAAVLTTFAFVTILLTLAGIAGVVARAVAERRREAAIRGALGASPGQLVRLLQLEVLAPVVAGLAIGLGVALISTRVLRSLLFGISPIDGWAFAAAFAVVLAAAFVASFWPARGLLRIDLTREIRDS